MTLHQPAWQLLGNGDYTWRVRDYASSYGYGTWTSPIAFTLNTACYSLTTGIAPVGAGTVTASPAPNCGSNYAVGTVVKLTAVANSGYVFLNWSGDASGVSNPVRADDGWGQGCDGQLQWASGADRAVSPPELTSWNDTFSWTGVNGATHYVLEVYDGSNTRILQQWFSTSAAEL